MSATSRGRPRSPGARTRRAGGSAWADPNVRPAMTVEIRPIDPAELEAWESAMRVGFHQPEPKPDDARARAEHFAGEMDWPRSHGAFDGGRVVATFRSYATELTVPGGVVTADALTTVTVAPTHRRRGILSTLMREDLAAAAARGEPVAILIASEW